MTITKQAKTTLDNMNELFDMVSTLSAQCAFFLHDYLRKLETDDFDPNALEKMKTVNDLLDKLQGGM